MRVKSNDAWNLLFVYQKECTEENTVVVQNSMQIPSILLLAILFFLETKSLLLSTTWCFPLCHHRVHVFYRSRASRTLCTLICDARVGKKKWRYQSCIPNSLMSIDNHFHDLIPLFSQCYHASRIAKDSFLRIFVVHFEQLPFHILCRFFWFKICLRLSFPAQLDRKMLSNMNAWRKSLIFHTRNSYFFRRRWKNSKYLRQLMTNGVISCLAVASQVRKGKDTGKRDVCLFGILVWMLYQFVSGKLFTFSDRQKKKKQNSCNIWDFCSGMWLKWTVHFEQWVKEVKSTLFPFDLIHRFFTERKCVLFTLTLHCILCFLPVHRRWRRLKEVEHISKSNEKSLPSFFVKAVESMQIQMKCKRFLLMKKYRRCRQTSKICISLSLVSCPLLLHWLRLTSASFILEKFTPCFVFHWEKN